MELPWCVYPPAAVLRHWPPFDSYVPFCPLRFPDALQGEEPFGAIHVGAAADGLPQELTSILAKHGRMVVPVGKRYETQVSAAQPHKVSSAQALPWPIRACTR